MSDMSERLIEELGEYPRSNPWMFLFLRVSVLCTGFTWKKKVKDESSFLAKICKSANRLSKGREKEKVSSWSSFEMFMFWRGVGMLSMVTLSYSNKQCTEPAEGCCCWVSSSCCARREGNAYRAMTTFRAFTEITTMDDHFDLTLRAVARDF